MSGRKPRRIRWAPNPKAALSVIHQLRPFDEEEAASLSNQARLAWHHLTHGTGSTEHFDTLARAMNAALVLSEPVGQPAVDVVIRAQLTLVAMQQRYHRQGRFGADAAALAEVPPALDLHDQLLSLSNPQQLVRAHAEAQDRIESGDVLAPAYSATSARL
ncbi:hypothetical protein [Polaromonas jejuensis]|uniref:Uncharacterized protein n=1 Tax=Polaromonas jejuensis TaxID=457502 RepID=A0ABW0QGZ4_9BURK|nr:hypothetical protein [Polaromonas jejuensis]